jgi:5'-phosphate synthase pdxT subunit
VLARLGDHPVAARAGRVTVCAFHPELSGDLRFHQQFLSEVSC